MKMQRRELLRGVAAPAAFDPAAGFPQGFGNQYFSSPIPSRDRLEQGPFDIDQDEGWLTALFTTASEKPGRLKLHGTLDPGLPAGGGIRLASFFLPAGFAGRVHLSAELEIRPGVLKPVAWACEQPLNPDGSIAVEVRKNDNPGWRKGV